MNKNVKGAIAVGAATLLLLGGGGTFALWNSSQELNAGTVNSGELSLADGTTSGWYHYDEYIADPVNATPITIATYHVVPEDELIYVVEGFGITAEGSNLFYTFGSNIDDAAATLLGFTATVEHLDGDALPGTGAAATAGQYSDGTANVETGTIVYTYASVTPETATFDAGLKVVFDADNQDNFNEEFDLSELEFVLQQVVALP